MEIHKISQYVKEQIRINIGICYKTNALDCFDQAVIIFTSLKEIESLASPCVAFPNDIENDFEPKDITSLRFNGTNYTLYNKIQRPSDDWEMLCIDGVPIWYRNQAGVIMPAWNHFHNIVDLFSFRAERDNGTRDRHQRLISEDNPYLAAGLGKVPVFNEFINILLAGLFGQQYGITLFSDISDWVKPIKVVLSHDCDVLLGNDRFSQTSRIYQMIKGLLKGDFYKLTAPIWIIYNFFSPRKFYMNNVYAMIDLERQFGFTSILYIINGLGGRFGFRNNFSAVKELLTNIPENWEVGLHYNYDTFLDDTSFLRQRRELENALGREVLSGRAHYLKFDPLRSFLQLETHGLKFDESLGIPDSNGFRLGTAGVFYPLLIQEERPSSVLALPLQFWDSHLNTEIKITEYEEALKHLRKIGGVVSLLFHPGQFYNKEDPNMDGVYYRTLKALKEVQAESVSPTFLIQQAIDFSTEKVDC
jgi:hypothetical protein